MTSTLKMTVGFSLLVSGWVGWSQPLPSDPRILLIQRYFQTRSCPAHEFAADFIQAADRHSLDWRLLPSLSMIETTGGKAAVNNNLFGWDSGRARFATLRDGIFLVAERLGNARYYRNKPLDRVLRTYNPMAGYARRVKAVMQALGPAEIILVSLE